MTVTRWPLCALMLSASFITATPASASSPTPPEPRVEWVQTSDDSVMDAESFDAANEAQSAEQTSPTGLEQAVTLDDGFHVFSLRSYGDYTIKLVATGEGNIENYRTEALNMANAVNAQFGVSMSVAAGTIPAPSNLSQPVVPNGEIWLMITASSPCGTLGGSRLGCGGVRASTLVEGEIRFSSGAVWLSPNLPPSCDQPVVSHEIGHAVGLNHFDDLYLGQTQIMAASTSCTTPTLPQAGDLNGIRWLSEPVPSNDTVATAAAVCPGDSSVSAHTWFATKQADEPTRTGSTARRSVWYRFVPRAEQIGGSATISTTNDGVDDFDTVLEVYTGATPLVSIANDNDSGPGNLSLVTIPVLAAQTYWVVVDGFGGVGLGRGETDVVFNLPDLLTTPFVPLCAPARVLDTRPSGQTVDGLHRAVGPIAANTMYQLPIAGRAGVPPTASSVVLNVTAVAPAGGGYVTVFPCGESLPNASNLNFAAGDVIPNSVFAKVGAAGSVCLFVSTTTNLLVDVSGFFPNTDVFSPLTVPGRLLDTRLGGQTVDHQHEGVGRLTANVPYTLPVAGRATVPAGAGLAPEAVLNITAVQPTTDGYLTAYACGQPIPIASNLNFVAGDIIPNLVVTQLGSGSVCLFSSTGTDLLVDVIGYMKPVSAVESLPASRRMLDTRPTGTTYDGLHQRVGRIAAGATYELPIAGRDAVPAGVIAVVLNVTVVSPSGSGFISVFPCGQNQPNASNLNFSEGEVIPNLVIAGVGTGGRVCFFTSADTDLLVDVSAWFP